MSLFVFFFYIGFLKAACRKKRKGDIIFSLELVEKKTEQRSRWNVDGLCWFNIIIWFNNDNLSILIFIICNQFQVYPPGNLQIPSQNVVKDFLFVFAKGVTVLWACYSYLIS